MILELAFTDEQVKRFVRALDVVNRGYVPLSDDADALEVLTAQLRAALTSTHQYAD